MRRFSFVIAGLLTASCSLEEAGNTSEVNNLATSRLSPGEIIDGKIALAQELSEFAREAASKNQSDAAIRASQEMISFLDGAGSYTPITGNGLRSQHEARNAIHQRQANSIQAGVSLQQKTLEALQVAAALQENRASDKLRDDLDREINDVLGAFKRSSLVTKAEREMFERKFSALSS